MSIPEKGKSHPNTPIIADFVSNIALSPSEISIARTIEVPLDTSTTAVRTADEEEQDETMAAKKRERSPPPETKKKGTGSSKGARRGAIPNSEEGERSLIEYHRRERR